MKDQLKALQAGLMSFAEFARETKTAWTAHAKKLHDRWKTPPFATADFQDAAPMQGVVPITRRQSRGVELPDQTGFFVENRVFVELR